jgi:hypothetical protein
MRRFSNCVKEDFSSCGCAESELVKAWILLNSCSEKTRFADICEIFVPELRENLTCAAFSMNSMRYHLAGLSECKTTRGRRVWSTESWAELFRKVQVSPEHDVRRFLAGKWKEQQSCTNLTLLVHTLQNKYKEFYDKMGHQHAVLYFFADACDDRLSEACTQSLLSCGMSERDAPLLFSLVRGYRDECACNPLRAIAQYKTILSKLVVAQSDDLTSSSPRPRRITVIMEEEEGARSPYEFTATVNSTVDGSIDSKFEPVVKGFAQHVGFDVMPIGRVRFAFLLVSLVNGRQNFAHFFPRHQHLAQRISDWIEDKRTAGSASELELAYIDGLVEDILSHPSRKRPFTKEHEVLAAAGREVYVEYTDMRALYSMKEAFLGKLWIVGNLQFDHARMLRDFVDITPKHDTDYLADYRRKQTSEHMIPVLEAISKIYLSNE